MELQDTASQDGNIVSEAKRLFPPKVYEIEGQLQHDVLVNFGALKTIWIWRENTGMFFGYNAVKRAMNLLSHGQVEAAQKVLRAMQPVRCGIPGRADTSGIIRVCGNTLERGRMIAIECKDEGEKLDEDQERWRDKFIESGGLYILAYQCWEVQVALWQAGIE